MQILPGVYLVNGFPYGRHQNGYLIRTEAATILIDSGDLTDDTFGDVRRNCARWDIDLAQVSHLLVTHAHFDHSSHAARLRETGTKIVASRDTADAMAAGDDRCIGYAVHRKYEPCETDMVVEEGQTLEISGLSLRCIAAPGHAKGLMVYEWILDGERLWFCGDLVEVGPECKSVKPGWSGGPDYDRRTYLETLRNLARLELDTLLPGHGPPAIGIGKRLIEQAYTQAMIEWR